MNDDLDFGPTIRGLNPGITVFDRYKLVRPLGRGGMGVVWLVEDARLGLQVAMKFLPESIQHDAVAIEDLRAETKRSLQLTHPNIVRVYTLEEAGGAVALSMEFVDGKTLTELRLEQPLKAFAADTLRPWLEQICGALAYAHEKAGMIHRDLKPANVMLTKDGEIKVADFGIASHLTESMSRMSRRSGGAVGTLVYMSPQQFQGRKPAVTDDVYSLGATLFELLTGKPPFFRGSIEHQLQYEEAPRLTERRMELGTEGCGEIPPHWEETVAACLDKDPARRPQSVRDLWQHLSQPAAAVAPAPPKPASPAPLPAGKRKSPLVAVAAIAAVAIGGGIWWKVAQKEETRPIGQIGPISQIPSTEDPAAKAEKARREKELADAKAKADAAEKAAAELAAEKAALEEQQRQETARRMAEEKKKAEEEAAKKNTPAARLAGATKDAPFENTLGMKFVPVPITGGPTGGQTVYFCMHETRVKDFRAFVAADKSFDYSKGAVPYTWTGTEFKEVPGKGWDSPGFNQDETHPVTCVSWEDAQAFIAWLNKQESGLTYRLPTDHEWSCAVGIGGRENAAASPESKDGKIEKVYPWGTSFPPPSGAGNYADSAAEAKFGKDFGVISGYTDGFAGTAPVMSFSKSRSRDGLYDLGGNVWEWCAGCYDGSDPSGKDRPLTKSRALRGGSWGCNGPAYLLSSRRGGDVPGDGGNSGFRLVLVGAGFGG